MRNDYVRAAMALLAEEEAQNLLQAAFEAEGWHITNVHRADPKHEMGADLDCERNGSRRLVAVKIKPRKEDIPQLETLATRASEGELFYAYFDDPTVHFRDKMKELDGTVVFLGPSALHHLFLANEVVDYLVFYFGVLPLARELAHSFSAIWQSREIVPAKALGTNEELQSLWELKDAVLKTRSAVGIIAMRWEADLMNRAEVDPRGFDRLLDDVTQDFDLVQRFTGGNMAKTFDQVHATTPHVLAAVWQTIRGSTYWRGLTALTERMKTREEVYEFARTFWAVPSSPLLERPRMNRAQMRFLYSGLSGILTNFSNLTRDLDHALDITWRDTRFTPPR